MVILMVHYVVWTLRNLLTPGTVAVACAKVLLVVVEEDETSGMNPDGLGDGPGGMG